MIWLEPDCTGLAPSERYSHSMNYYSDLNIIIIYGGRNDHLNRNAINSFVLNDIFTLNLETLTWVHVELLG